MATSPSTSANPLNILIVGAGVAGPTLALLLQRSNPSHHITVIERWESLCTGGQQIDLKDQGVPIMQRLGLTDELRDLCVQEDGMELVDSKGNSLIRTGIRKAGAQQKAFQITNEFEFMRGDFVHMMYKNSVKERETLDSNGPKRGSLTYLFGTSITALTQNTSTSATVTLSSGQTHTYDLVVAADGQGSRTRRLAFGEATSRQAFTSLNINAAFFDVPRVPRETSLARIYIGPENRMVLTRTGNRPATQVFRFQLKNAARTPLLKASHKLSIPEQKAAWTQAYANAGSESKRYTAGLAHANDFYATEIAQVKMPHNTLYTGRVVLLGDAGYCPSSFTGKGTTLALIGAYVLADELSRRPNDINAALSAYEETIREPVDEAQKLPTWLNGGAALFPQSTLGLCILYQLLWLVSALNLQGLVGALAGFLPSTQLHRWVVPEYPSLNVKAPEGK
ncbi:hypothetical protein ACJQWK_05530 [Exserohilum turcicum]|uniref:FAD-binding domain-containing protein n=1 Tax=Exserohilum turcicum (strain 28A) TaxID=671987 RepID=R0I9U7_EXST2|nr:uncharacterized protein SETTUDRAFT_98116 [Exserohilum turcica Et28A]EOA82106.1 hypothetical protein SETTUDRAFT_98116 [Exserohilum turcica Et28A]